MGLQYRSESDQPTRAGKPLETLYEEAQKLMNDAGNKEVIGALEMFLVIYPDYAVAHNDLGVLYYGEGEKEKALKHYEQAVALETQSPVFQKNLADFYYVEQGRVEEAMELYVKVLSANPTDIETLLVLGHICVSLKRFDDAEVFYNRVLELEPWNMDARERLDELVEGRGSEIRGQRSKVISQGSEVGGQRSSGTRVESAAKMYQDARELIKSGMEKEGISALERLLKIYPDFGLAHNDLGVFHYNRGNKDEALMRYERAAKLEPYNNTFQKNLADFYYVEAGRMEEALQIYVKLLDADPTDLETLLILGEICESLKKTDDAKVFYNKVLELEPWNMDARERLDELVEARGSEIRGQRSEVGGQGSEVGDQCSRGTRVESAEKMYQDAQELINGNMKMDAVDALEKLVASYPDHALAHNDLGVLYLNEGDKEKTLHHYEKAAVLGPQNSVFQKNLADFYYVMLGRAEEALEIYLKILEANPTDIETLLIMGHICVSLNNFDDAKVFYNRVLELEPWNADAREKLDQLAKARETEVRCRRSAGH